MRPILTELEHFYDLPHNESICGYCRAELTIMDPGVIYKFAESGVTASGQDLRKKHAGDRLHHFAKAHQQKRGGSYRDALAVAQRLNPEIVRAYLGHG